MYSCTGKDFPLKKSVVSGYQSKLQYYVLLSWEQKKNSMERILKFKQILTSTEDKTEVKSLK